jgi:hypothetical protein
MEVVGARVQGLRAAQLALRSDTGGDKQGRERKESETKGQ